MSFDKGFHPPQLPRPSQSSPLPDPLPYSGTGKPGHLGFLWLVVAGRSSPFRLSPPPLLVSASCLLCCLTPEALGLCLPGSHRSGTLEPRSPPPEEGPLSPGSPKSGITFQALLSSLLLLTPLITGPLLAPGGWLCTWWLAACTALT